MTPLFGLHNFNAIYVILTSILYSFFFIKLRDRQNFNMPLNMPFFKENFYRIIKKVLAP